MTTPIETRSSRELEHRHARNAVAGMHLVYYLKHTVYGVEGWPLFDSNEDITVNLWLDILCVDV